MGPEAEALQLVVRLVAAAAEACGLEEARDRAIELIKPAIGATHAIIVRGDLAHVDARISGHDVARDHGALIRHELRMNGIDNPLLAPIAQGDLTPSSARRRFGAEAWTQGYVRASALEKFGCDELMTIPLQGSPTELTTLMFGRRGSDFTDADLALAQAVQPVVISLDRLVGRGPLPAAGESGRALGLTQREGEVLRLLAEGHTAERIGRLAGCAPRTVHRHLSSIYAKLGVGDRLTAVTQARELGVLRGR